MNYFKFLKKQQEERKLKKEKRLKAQEERKLKKEKRLKEKNQFGKNINDIKIFRKISKKNIENLSSYLKHYNEIKKQNILKLVIL